MRVFVTGASGALGSRLVPQLIDAGHEVVGTYNSPASAELLRTLGARPLLVDLLDVRAVRKAVLDNEPEAIVHEATALGKAKFGRNFDKAFAMTNQLRTKGTDALLAAAREAGVRWFVAQSFAALPVHPGWRSDQDRGRSTGPDVTAAYPTGLGGDGPSRRGGHRLRRNRSALWRLLRRCQRRLGRARA